MANKTKRGFSGVAVIAANENILLEDDFLPLVLQPDNQLGMADHHGAITTK